MVENNLKGFLNVAGERGPIGPKGDPGIGIPTGGTNGQLLIKQGSRDYEVAWMDLMYSKSTLDTPLEYTIPYDLGRVNSLDLVLPETVGGDGSIVVMFIANTAFTPTISGTYEGDVITPVLANSEYAYVFYWSKKTNKWHLDIVPMDD